MGKEIVSPLSVNARCRSRRIKFQESSQGNRNKGYIFSFDDSGYIFLHNFLKPCGSCFPMRANVRTHFQSSNQSL